MGQYFVMVLAGPSPPSPLRRQAGDAPADGEAMSVRLSEMEKEIWETSTPMAPSSPFQASIFCGCVGGLGWIGLGETRRKRTPARPYIF